MSTHSEGDSKSFSEGNPKPASEREPKLASGKSKTKIYCEICKVPCMNAMMLQTHCAGKMHKKRERILKEKGDPVISKELMSVKRPLSKNIRSLKDFMKDPDREEPLIGLEYVVEIRFQGRRDPCYECQLCQFNTEMAPMIEHLIGQRHRKLYLVKHYPDRVKRNPNEAKEEKITFFRRVAREVEKTEGLKMYKREGFERPSKPSTSAQKRARYSSGYKPENDPVRREKALEYMENFEITSDEEAAVVVTIAQSLSEALKAFCEKKATLNHIKRLPSLMKQRIRNTKQHKSNKPSECYKDLPGDSWNHAFLTNELAQLQSLLQHAPSVSSTPTNSYTYQRMGETSSYDLSCKDLATVPALENSFALQPGGFGTGIEWMKQFNQSASAYSHLAPAKEKSLCFRTSQSSCIEEMEDEVLDFQGDGSQIPIEQMAESKLKKLGSFRNSCDSRTCSLTPVSYPPPRRYQTTYSSWYHRGPDNKNQMPDSYFSSESNEPDWAQQTDYPKSDLDDDLGSYSSFSGGPLYQQQNTEVHNTMCGLTADIMSQLQGKDAATLASMLQELLPHYPGLQNIDIHAFAQALSEMN